MTDGNSVKKIIYELKSRSGQLSNRSNEHSNHVAVANVLEDPKSSERDKMAFLVCLWIRGRIIHFFKIKIVSLPMYGFMSFNPLSILFSNCSQALKPSSKLYTIGCSEEESISLVFKCSPHNFTLSRCERSEETILCT
jgi:hypothetical protein